MENILYQIYLRLLDATDSHFLSVYYGITAGMS